METNNKILLLKLKSEQLSEIAVLSILPKVIQAKYLVSIYDTEDTRESLEYWLNQLRDINSRISEAQQEAKSLEEIQY